MEHIQYTDQIGKYKILRPLGKGGEGSVFLAMHLLTQQLWAVKEIKKKDGKREYHELSMFKKLKHPSLPMIVDVLETNESVCLVMEYIKGFSLEKLLQEKGRLSAEQVMDVGQQIGSALCYLHDPRRGILHLDLKPSNVLLTEKGKVYLVDFGAAFIENVRPKTLLVTDGFSAPELYKENVLPDIRADVYGFGALLFTLISGVRYESFMEKSKVPGCPDPLERVIRQCLKKEPKDRYQTMQQVVSGLTAVRRSRKRENGRVRLWVAVLLALFTVSGASAAVSEVLNNRVAPEWDYEKLVQEAACQPEETSFESIQKAVTLQPQRQEAYLCYLDQCDADVFLSEQEDRNLRTLLYSVSFGNQDTNEELLEKDPFAYADLAYRIGCIYWHDYRKDSGGGKRIGAGWFSKALSYAEHLQPRPDWYEMVCIYQRIGGFYEGLCNGSGTLQADMYKTYWEALGELLSLQIDTDSGTGLQIRFCSEAIDQITLLSGQLTQHGVDVRDIQEMVQAWTARASAIAASEDGESEYIENLLSEVQEKADNAAWVIRNLPKKKTER